MLGNTCISGLVEPDGVGSYRESLVFFRSLVKQAIGRAEEMERRGRLAVSPNVAARWSWLIRPLERVRQVVVTHPRSLNPLLLRIESWPVYRLISVIATFGGFASAVVLVVAVIAALVFFL